MTAIDSTVGNLWHRLAVELARARQISYYAASADIDIARRSCINDDAAESMILDWIGR